VDEDVERAKIALKATMLMGLDGNTNICEDFGRQLLTYGQRLTPTRYSSGSRSSRRMT
jgi:processing peptidase subunit beta